MTALAKKTSITRKTLQLYTAQYRQHPWLVLGSAMIGPGTVLQNIVSPLFIAAVLGQLASNEPVNMHYVWWAAISMLGGAAIQYLGDRYCSVQLTVLTMKSLYDRCLKAILSQEYDFFANTFTGSLVTKANRLVKGYELFVNIVILEMLGLWCSVLTAIIIMILFNPLLGTVVGVFWAFAILIVFYLVRGRIPIRRAAVAKESELSGELADAATNAMTVKTFAREAAEEQRYSKTSQQTTEFLRRSWHMAIRNHYALHVLCITLQLIVLVGGIYAVQHHELTIAAFLLFQVYALRIIDSISKASFEMRMLEGVFGDATEMTELIDRTPTVLDPPRPERSHIGAGHIELRDVHFAYQPDASATQTLFAGLNLTIQPGERVGLVGPSGGGKTTITKLLLRFMDVQSGAVTIDGQNISAVRQADLHEAIAYVPQEPLLFHRSLLENIRYGKPDATESEVIDAAKRAFAHDFITSLPDGYKTLVGERGIKLSGGQRQRVAIARAMLKNAPLLILDEATSALDSESERYIQKALWELMQGKTSVVIAHRLSTIQHLDRIIVLEAGRIIEDGSHTELLAKNGLYAKLWAHQSGGFIEE